VTDRRTWCYQLSGETFGLLEQCARAGYVRTTKGGSVLSRTENGVSHRLRHPPPPKQPQNTTPKPPKNPTPPRGTRLLIVHISPPTQLKTTRYVLDQNLGSVVRPRRTGQFVLPGDKEKTSLGNGGRIEKGGSFPRKYENGTHEGEIKCEIIAGERIKSNPQSG